MVFSEHRVQAADADISQRLFAAVRANDIVAVRRIVGQGADPFVFDERGLAPVDVAVDKGYFDIAHYLLAVQNQRFQSDHGVKAEPAVPTSTLPAVTAAPVQPVTVSKPAPSPEQAAVSPVAPRPAMVPATAPQTVQLVNEVKRQPQSPPQPEPEAPQSQEPAVVPAVTETRGAQPQEPVTAEQVEKTETPVFERLLDFLKGDEEPKPDTAITGKADDIGEADDSIALVEPLSVPTTLPGESAQSVTPHVAPPRPKPVMNTLTQQVVTEPEPPVSVAATEPSAKIAESVEPVQPTPSEPQSPEVIARAASEPASEVAPVSEKPQPDGTDENNLLRKFLDLFENSESPPESAPRPTIEAAPEPAVKTIEDTVGGKDQDIPVSSESVGPAPIADVEPAPAPASDGPTALERIVEFLKGDQSKNPKTTPEAVSTEENYEKQDPSSPRPQSPQIQSAAEPEKVGTSTVDETPMSEAAPKVEFAEVGKASAASPEPSADTPSLFGRLVGFFNPEQTSGGVVQEQPKPESSDVATKTAASDADAKQMAPEQTASLTQTLTPESPAVTTKPVPPEVSPPSPTPSPEIVLRADDMVFGDIGRLGKKLGGDRIGQRDCISKPAWGSTFCIENIDWPDEIRESFGNLSFYAGGGRAIVRYDGARASQYHVLFPVSSFNRLAQYFKHKLGPASESPEIWTSMLGEPRRFNKTFRWRAPVKDGNGYVMVEMREIDDLRWSAPPDVHHGVVRLYREGARTVFELLTTADLLLMQVRKGLYQEDIAPGERPKG